MCNLYSLHKRRDEIGAFFKVAANRVPHLDLPLPAIFPGYTAPVVRLADDGEREIVPMSWSLVLPQVGKAPRRVTNVRDDKILGSRFWKPSFLARRCLVPASSYCEANDQTPTTWHWFALKDKKDERPLFAFPGIWKHWTGSVKKAGPVVNIDTYSFMTTAPNELTASINHERMPVLLSSERDFATWLYGTPEQAFGLVQSYDANEMRIVQSGFEKRDLLAAA